jgi:uncharacterized protein YggT (Ycf19 family)
MVQSTTIQWKRFSVEIAAIVGSILLAFAIDAWWQEAQDQKSIEHSLARLADNLSATVSDLQSDLGILDISAAAARDFINGEPEGISTDKAAAGLARLFDTRSPNVELAEYEALTSTGRLRDIPNVDIIRLLTSIYDQMPKLIRLADQTGNEARDLRKMVASEILYNQLESYSLDRPNFELSDRGLEILMRADVREQIVDAGYRASFQAIRYRALIADIENAIALIEVELQ